MVLEKCCYNSEHNRVMWVDVNESSSEKLKTEIFGWPQIRELIDVT